MLFELNPEKIEIGLTIRRGGKPFRVGHELRRPTEKDWIGYDERMSVAFEDADEPGSERVVDDSLGAACWFWDALSKSVTGYSDQVPENFRSLVAPEHKRAAIAVLTLVAPSLESPGREGLFLVSDEEVIRLRARRETEFRCLVHRFKPPTPAQRIEFSRLMADSYTIRGRKSGKDKVVLPSRLRGIIELYDELITGTEGYCINGNPANEREDAVRYMDAQHKRVAVQSLFAADEVEIMEPEKVEVTAD